MLALLLLTLSATASNPQRSAIACVDMLELNHIDRGNGNEFCQWIAWDWEPSQRAFVVVAWQCAKSDDVYRVVNGRYQVIWDRCEVPHKIVSAASFRETWTTHDPEIENQRVWTIAARRQLW